MDLLRIAQRAVTELIYRVALVREHLSRRYAFVLAMFGMCPHTLLTSDADPLWPPQNGTTLRDVRCAVCGKMVGTREISSRRIWE